MILLDTNIVIDMVNNFDDPNWDLLLQDDVVLCGTVIAELYQGIKSKKEEKSIELFIRSVDFLDFVRKNESKSAVWKDFGSFLANLRKNELQVPFQDAMIAFIGIKYNCKILTKDKHFKLIQAVDERVQLF